MGLTIRRCSATFQTCRPNVPVDVRMRAAEPVAATLAKDGAAKDGARIEAGNDPGLADGGWRIAAAGRWTLEWATAASDALDRAPKPPGGAAVRLDLAQVDALDTVGAYLLNRLAERLGADGHAVSVAGLRPEHSACSMPCTTPARRRPTRSNANITRSSTWWCAPARRR